MITIFIITIIIIIFICLGYPTLLLLLSLFKKNKEKCSSYFPTISLIIACHNEQDVIEEKILNSLKLNYSKEKLEIIIFSDGSTDNSEEIIKKYKNQNIKLLSFSNHPGKTICQNESVKYAKGEIIVFSDANSMYEKNAILELIKPLQDKKNGVSFGKLKYKSQLNKEENKYWTYENLIKKSANKLNMLIGANGAIYAVRKKDYIDLKPWAMSDLVLPLRLNLLNLKTIFCSKAVVWEDTPSSNLKRKIRIILPSLNSLPEFISLLNIFKYRQLSFALFWHKLMRWLSPLWLILAFFLNLAIILNPESLAIFSLMFYLQIVLYLLGILGRYIKLLKPLNYFLLVNLASLIAIALAISGKKQITWKV